MEGTIHAPLDREAKIRGSSILQYLNLQGERPMNLEECFHPTDTRTSKPRIVSTERSSLWHMLCQFEPRNYPSSEFVAAAPSMTRAHSPRRRVPLDVRKHLLDGSRDDASVFRRRASFEALHRECFSGALRIPVGGFKFQVREKQHEASSHLPVVASKRRRQEVQRQRQFGSFPQDRGRKSGGSKSLTVWP